MEYEDSEKKRRGKKTERKVKAERESGNEERKREKEKLITYEKRNGDIQENESERDRSSLHSGQMIGLPSPEPGRVPWLWRIVENVTWILQ